MTEIDPETEGWHIPHSRRKGCEVTLHTDKRCSQLQRCSQTKGPVKVKQLGDHWHICGHCDDSSNSDSGGQELYLKLSSEDFSPDEGQSLEEFAEEVET